jgi:hypothetical protein
MRTLDNVIILTTRNLGLGAEENIGIGEKQKSERLAGSSNCVEARKPMFSIVYTTLYRRPLFCVRVSRYPN